MNLAEKAEWVSPWGCDLVGLFWAWPITSGHIGPRTVGLFSMVSWFLGAGEL